MILIDSSGWIEFFSDGKNADKYPEYVLSAKKETHITSSVIIYEVFKCIKSVFNDEKAIQAIASILGNTTLVAIDDVLAIAAADISITHQLGMADATIKATADRYHAKIITSDGDFQEFSSVVFIAKR